MPDLTRDDLVFDWNTAAPVTRPPQRIEFDDETLRDGLQCPSVRNPGIDEKVRLLHLMSELGLGYCNIGLPGAGPHVVKTVTRLAEEIRDSKLKLEPNCAARTWPADIAPVAEIQQKVGLPIEVSTFIGSSAIRAYTEDWSVQTMLKHAVEALKFAAKEGLAVMFVTEDTTRAHPQTLEALYGAALEHGAKRLCFCDTVGHATPDGARNLIAWAVKLVAKSGRKDVKIDWHGHMDRGLGVLNNLAALQAGAHRVHGTALGIGERAGNAAARPHARQPQAARLDRQRPAPPGRLRAPDEPGHGRADSHRLPGLRARRLRDRHRRARGRGDQGAAEGRRVAGRPRLLGRAGRRLRIEAGHPRRADERQEQRRVVAQGARLRRRATSASSGCSRRPRTAASC
jgi:hypothetical protein